MKSEVIKKIESNDKSKIKYFHTLETTSLIGKYISAFANSEGGYIVFGVRDSVGKLVVKGLSNDFYFEKIKSDLSLLLNENEIFTMDSFNYKGLRIVYLEIKKSNKNVLFEGRKYVMGKDTILPELFKNKIFISHSSKDKKYGEAIVELLRGLGLRREQIIFTSDDNYGIPLDTNIFDYLKDQINGGVYMIYLLSDNYYDSVACLNEMGAAWIVQNHYTVIGVPSFNFDNPKFREGSIDPRRIGFLINNKKRIVEFKNNILEQFELTIDEADWNNILDRHLIKVEELSK